VESGIFAKISWIQFERYYYNLFKLYLLLYTVHVNRQMYADTSILISWYIDISIPFHALFFINIHIYVTSILVYCMYQYTYFSYQ